MKIVIDQQTYEITDEAIAAAFGHIFVFSESQYNKLPEAAKIAAMAGVRALLWHAEKTESDQEKKKLIRPPKGADPTLHLIKLLLGFIANELPHVQITIDTTENRTISNVGIENTGPGGGSLSADGNIGKWEDDRRQAAGQAVGKALPVSSPLHS